MSSDPASQAFLEYAARKLEDHWFQVRRCAGLLSDDQLWHRPNERSNSVGNLLLHLRGNISQWILGGVGGEPVQRDRQAEFDQRGPLPRGDIVNALDETIRRSCEVIRGLPAGRILSPLVVQDYRVTPLTAIFHVVEHLAFHAGQIVTTTKWLLNVDLSLYDQHGHRFDGRSDAVP